MIGASLAAAAASVTRVAINGFGRIGRMFLRAVLVRGAAIELVAVNDVNEPDMLAYLLEFDTVHGRLASPVASTEHTLTVGVHELSLWRERDPVDLPWAELEIDVVIECTGAFTMRDDAERHLKAGARRVVISAPATGADLTVCMGVNEDMYDPGHDFVISNASCTTNCLAPMIDVLHRAFGVRSAFMTTVHAYTNDQNLLDLPHRGHTRDLRRSRAAAQNIVPSTTGAARAINDIIPELAGRVDGVALRVPVADASIVDLVCDLDRVASIDAINDAFADAAATERFRGVLGVTDRPLVSSDIVGRPESCTFSAPDTMVQRRHSKVFGWYDNEWGYANRLVDVVELVGPR